MTYFKQSTMLLLYLFLKLHKVLQPKGSSLEDLQPVTHTSSCVVQWQSSVPFCQLKHLA